MWLRSLAGGVVVSEGSGIFVMLSLRQEQAVSVSTRGLRGRIPTVRLLSGMQADSGQEMPFDVSTVCTVDNFGSAHRLIYFVLMCI